jgi:hypothetical protein
MIYTGPSGHQTIRGDQLMVACAYIPVQEVCMPKKYIKQWERGKWPRPSKEATFYSKFDVSPSGCWLWNGWKNSDGYALLRRKAAHRFAYELLRGEIPPGTEIDHLCSVRHCVNPEHMECVSHAENIRRSWERGANDARRYRLADIHKAKTHCPNGHKYSHENTIVDRWNGARRCRICETAKFHRYQAKAKLRRVP